VERKNIKEKGKEGRWENQKKICFFSLTHTHLCIMHGTHTIRPVVHANQHPGSFEVAGCTPSLYWVWHYSFLPTKNGKEINLCAFTVSVPFSHSRTLSLSALCKLWECALQQEWCDFRHNLFWAKFKLRFSIAVKISFYFRQKISISTQPFFGEI
jgi:hypothetical protein